MCQGTCQVRLNVSVSFRNISADTTYSFTAQFDHLATTAFARPELDIPEQQLALAYTIDYDLDNFAAAVGFARQAVFTLAHESGKYTSRGNASLQLTFPRYRGRCGRVFS